MMLRVRGHKAGDIIVRRMFDNGPSKIERLKIVSIEDDQTMIVRRLYIHERAWEFVKEKARKLRDEIMALPEMEDV